MAGARVIQTSDKKRFAVRFEDPSGATRTLRVTRYKPAARKIAERIDRLLDAATSGDPVDKETRKWAEGIKDDWRDKLVTWGVLGGSHLARVQPIEQHVEAWEKSLETKGTGTDRIETLDRRIRTILRHADADRLADFSSEAIEVGLQRMRENGNAPNTLRGHRQAADQFLKWCVFEGLIQDNPVVRIRPVKGGVLRKRRGLDLNEQRWLLRVTHDGPTRKGRKRDGSHGWSLTGPERSLMYRLVLSTGLRSHELFSLTQGSFLVERLHTQPTLMLAAKDEKNRKGHVFRLKPELAEMLRKHLATRTEIPWAFSLPRPDAMAKLIRRDLADAKVAWIAEASDDDKQGRPTFLAETTREGRFDFHGLRYSFIGNLARAGVPLQMAVKLARHSSADLTTQIYTQLGYGDEQKLVDTMPDLDFPASPMHLAATGTAGDTQNALQKVGLNPPQHDSTPPNSDAVSEPDAEPIPLRHPELDPNSPQLSPTPPNSDRATSETRTPDLSFTKAPLYQLS